MVNPYESSTESASLDPELEDPQAIRRRTSGLVGTLAVLSLLAALFFAGRILFMIYLSGPGLSFPIHWYAAAGASCLAYAVLSWLLWRYARVLRGVARGDQSANAVIPVENSLWFALTLWSMTVAAFTMGQNYMYWSAGG